MYQHSEIYNLAKETIYIPDQNTTNLQLDKQCNVILCTCRLSDPYKRRSKLTSLQFLTAVPVVYYPVIIRLPNKYTAQ